MVWGDGKEEVGVAVIKTIWAYLTGGRVCWLESRVSGNIYNVVAYPFNEDWCACPHGYNVGHIVLHGDGTLSGESARYISTWSWTPIVRVPLPPVCRHGKVI